MSNLSDLQPVLGIIKRLREEGQEMRSVEKSVVLEYTQELEAALLKLMGERINGVHDFEINAAAQEETTALAASLFTHAASSSLLISNETSFENLAHRSFEAAGEFLRVRDQTLGSPHR